MQLVNLKPQETYNSVSMLSGWSTRNILQVQNVGGNQYISNAQAPLSITAEYWGFTTANFNNDGSDIRFTTTDNTIIPHYLVRFDKTTKVLVAFLKLNLAVKGNQEIFIYYGNAGASTSSDKTILERYQATSFSTSLVRFNEGSGSTSANTGTVGGNYTLNGSYTWQSSDLLGGSTNSLLLDGASAYITKTGINDSWTQGGFMSINVNFTSLTGEQGIFSKVNRLKTSSPDEGDYLYFYKRSDNKLGFDVYRGSQNKTYTGVNTVSSGVWNQLFIRWTYKDRQGLGTSVRYKMEVYLNGVLEITTDNTTILPTVSGSIGAWTIGCKRSNIDGTTLSNYLNGAINDHIIESKYPSNAKRDSIFQQRKYIPLDVQSKLIISDLLESGGLIDAGANGEPCLLWDNNMWRLYYLNIKSAGSDIRYKEISSISITGTNTWTNDQLIKAGANNGIVRKFGSTYYLYYRTASGNGPISVATSSDGYTFGSPTTVLANAGSGFGSTGYYNTDVIFNPKDNLYYMYVETRDTTNVYLIGMATCSTPNGTFTLNIVNPTNLLYGNGAGNCGGPSVDVINNKAYMFYHCDPTAGTLPMEGYFASTRLDDMFYFDKPNNGNYLKMDRPKEADQAADIIVREGNNEVVMMYNQICNTSLLESYMTVSKYDSAEFIHLVSDFNIIIRGQSRVYETETNTMIGLGLTNEVQRNVLDRRLKDLKGYYNPNYTTTDLWASKITAYYAFIGGSATLHKYNLKNVVDSDAAFRLVFTGCTHSNRGIIFNGTSDYANTKVNMASHTTINDIAASFHIVAAIGSTFAFGAADTTNTGLYGNYGFQYAENSYQCYSHAGNGTITTTGQSAIGYNAMSRTTASLLKAYRTGAQVGSSQTFTNPYGVQPSREMYIGCRSLNGAPQAYASFTLADFLLSKGLTDAEILNNYNSNQWKDSQLGRA